MHKKPFVAVLILGLLLLIPSLAEASIDRDYQTGNFTEQPVPRIARNLDKGPAQPGQPLTGGLTSIEAGVSRTGATFCDGRWQGAAVQYFPNWFYGDEYYAAYQDVENLGSCDGLDGLYTFDVTKVTQVMFSYGALVVHGQPMVFENGGDKLCPVPGGMLCAGPLYEFSLPGGGGWTLGMPLVDECCSFYPYFAAVYWADYFGPGVFEIVTDDGSANVSCYTRNRFSVPWYDMIDDIGAPGNMTLWSEGNAYDQNNCPGVPGECLYRNYRNGDDIDYTYWDDPDGATGGLLEDYYVRFNADVSCTLMSMRVALADFNDGTKMRVRVYGNDNIPGTVGGLPIPDLAPGGANMEGYVDVDLTTGLTPLYPAWIDVDLTSLGPLVYGPAETFFISVTTSPATPDPVNDYITVITNTRIAPPDPDNHSGAFIGLFGQYQTFGQTFGASRDLILDAFTCCEVVERVEEPCASPGPDDWNTWAHDYQRTSATTIEVGDPCQLVYDWHGDLAQYNSFNEPVIANDRVYISSEIQTRVYNLGTGALIKSLFGLPYIFTNDRCNVTVEGAAAYVTGGDGQSVSKWDVDLTVLAWCNGIGAGTGPLGGADRFGGITVADIGGTMVVFAAAENGSVWAFDDATGALFGGWGTNPVVLDNPVLHGTAYDGSGLYVGTTALDNSAGSIYRLDPATGAIVWNTIPGGGTEGFPAGVSVDVDAIYAASSDAGGGGNRYKLDKTTGSVGWSAAQARTLYGTPAIGRNWIYMGQDGIGAGVIAVDKGTGAPVYNWAGDGVGQVTQPVSITCDDYIFAGDRSGRWWLLDIDNQTYVWREDVPNFSIVNGTALGSHSNGDQYAVVSFRSGAPSGLAGKVAAFKFGQGNRPRVEQNTYETDVPVEFGLSTGNPWNEPDVFRNSGCADLDFTSFTVHDPLPDPAAKSFRRSQSNYAAAVASRMIDGNYNAYFDQKKTGKSLGRALELVNPEMTRADVAKDEALTAMNDSKRASSRMAASANALVRTGSIVVTTPLPGGALTDVDWLFDGSNLNRGQDDETIEFFTNDPDRIGMNYNPILSIHYLGGCLPASTYLTWNYIDEPNGVINAEAVFNNGLLGLEEAGDNLIWDGEANGDVYTAGFFLAGEADAVSGQKQYHIGAIYSVNQGNYDRLFLPDPFPGPSCDFQGDVDVLMGYKREAGSGCPGTPEEIRGEWVRTAFIDTNEARVGEFGEAIGTRVVLTEIGSYDPLYGDFKVQHYEVTNRDAVDKGPIYGGSFYDWDVHPSYADNNGDFSLQYNGYALWDWNDPALAFGILDPNLPTAYGGVDPTFNRPQRINPMGQSDGVSASGGYDGPFQGGADADPWEEAWDYSVARLPQFENGPYENGIGNGEDCFGLITMKGQTLPASGTIEFNQVLYAVDATSNDFNVIEGLGLELAQRAAKWCGYARGDANDDGDVNILDVCWLLSANQIYPDTYNGDVDISGTVDGADEAYLLDYVTGLGPAPLGQWRFTF